MSQNDISKEIKDRFQLVVKQGLTKLKDGMERFKDDPFNPSKPYRNYNKKNEYFEASNAICLGIFWKIGYYDLCEKYFLLMLNYIKEYEIKEKVYFNKGMIYVNLGVSQIAQNKIDEGFANILKAHMEDSPYHKSDSTKSVFKLPHYKQFENHIIDHYLIHIKKYTKLDNSKASKNDIVNLVTSLDTDEHILLISLLYKFRNQLVILKDKDNRFTRLQLFLLLQDFCLFIENAIKTKTGETGTLKFLLNNLFSRSSGRPRTWWSEFDGNHSLAKADNITDFERNLTDIFGISNLIAQRLLTCWAIRNFSSHNIDTRNDYIYNHIEPILENILFAILFLNETNCI